MPRGIAAPQPNNKALRRLPKLEEAPLLRCRAVTRPHAGPCASAGTLPGTAPGVAEVMRAEFGVSVLLHCVIAWKEVFNWKLCGRVIEIFHAEVLLVVLLLMFGPSPCAVSMQEVNPDDATSMPIPNAHGLVVKCAELGLRLVGELLCVRRSYLQCIEGALRDVYKSDASTSGFRCGMFSELSTLQYLGLWQQHVLHVDWASRSSAKRWRVHPQSMRIQWTSRHHLKE